MVSSRYTAYRTVLCAFLLFLPVAAFAMLQFPAAGERVPADPIARLQEKINSGEVNLEFEANRGYLSSLLRSLKIPVSSQGFVFSKTSLQIDRIAPWAPRAIYFNDDVYVGFVQGGPILEIASMDPRSGAVFYTLDQEAAERPVFRRETTTCLMCHDSSASTGGVPGLIVRSVYPDRYGYVVPTSDKGVTNDRTPLEDRWGGWFVTGTSGDQLHMGNMLASMPAQQIGNYRNFLAEMDLRPNANITDLHGRFNTKHYLRPDSDIVALLILSHQASVHNLLTKTSYNAGKAGADTVGQIVEPLVRAMLFVKEAPLTGPIKGTTNFAAEFAAQGPRDKRGRSLRDLDMERRMFRYPLSYLIYSESFDALPSLAKSYFYGRLREILSGRDHSPQFAHLTASDRAAILDILEQTKPDFAALTFE